MTTENENWHQQCASAARRVAAEAFDVSDAVLIAPNRCRAHIALARQVAMYLTHVVASISLTDIALAFSRDRTTVSHACRRIEDKRDELLFDLQIEQLEARMRRELERIKLAEVLEAKTVQKNDMAVRVGERPRYGLSVQARILPFRRN